MSSKLTNISLAPEDEDKLVAGLAQLAPVTTDTVRSLDLNKFYQDRQRYERGLIAWVRGNDPTGLRVMKEALERISSYEPDTRLAGFWFLASISMDTFVNEQKDSARTVPAQLARQLKKREEDQLKLSAVLVRGLWQRLYSLENDDRVEAALGLLEIGADYPSERLEDIYEWFKKEDLLLGSEQLPEPKDNQVQSVDGNQIFRPKTVPLLSLSKEDKNPKFEAVDVTPTADSIKESSPKPNPPKVANLPRKKVLKASPNLQAHKTVYDTSAANQNQFKEKEDIQDLLKSIDDDSLDEHINQQIREEQEQIPTLEPEAIDVNYIPEPKPRVRSRSFQMPLSPEIIQTAAAQTLKAQDKSRKQEPAQEFIKAEDEMSDIELLKLRSRPTQTFVKSEEEMSDIELLKLKSKSPGISSIRDADKSDKMPGQTVDQKYPRLVVVRTLLSAVKSNWQRKHLSQNAPTLQIESFNKASLNLEREIKTLGSPVLSAASKALTNAIVVVLSDPSMLDEAKLIADALDEMIKFSDVFPQNGPGAEERLRKQTIKLEQIRPKKFDAGVPASSISLESIPHLNTTIDDMHIEKVESSQGSAIVTRAIFRTQAPAFKTILEDQKCSSDHRHLLSLHYAAKGLAEAAENTNELEIQEMAAALSELALKTDLDQNGIELGKDSLFILISMLDDVINDKEITSADDMVMAIKRIIQH